MSKKCRLGAIYSVDARLILDLFIGVIRDTTFRDQGAHIACINLTTKSPETTTTPTSPTLFDPEELGVKALVGEDVKVAVEALPGERLPEGFRLAVGVG